MLNSDIRWKNYCVKLVHIIDALEANNSLLTSTITDLQNLEIIKTKSKFTSITDLKRILKDNENPKNKHLDLLKYQKDQDEN